MSLHTVFSDNLSIVTPTFRSARGSNASPLDPLTHLPGRTTALQALEASLRQRPSRRRFGAILLGFDRFKLINTTLGRQTGDVLLTHVARRLEAVVEADLASHPDGHHAFAARWGGDQFVVVAENLADQAHLLSLAERVSHELTQPFLIEGHEMCVRVSIGVVADRETYGDADQMLRDAQTAMSRAGSQYESGAGTYGCSKVGVAVFTPEMHDEACRRMQLELALRRAITREQLTLMYQPIISFATGQVACFEALARWNDPQLGLVSPAEFIPIAEETGLILPLGAWVLRKACGQLRQWRHDGVIDDTIGMSVNLSRVQMQQPDLVEMIHHAIKDAGLCLGNGDLHLEITESAIMTDPPRAVRLLDALRQLGVSISMDDFGTQYSSLSCLHQFPINTIKIDRAFIRNLEQRREYAAVVHAIVTLAHNLDMQVTAEGIETSAQTVQLLTMECDHAQGYRFARPMLVDQTAQYMATYKAPTLGETSDVIAA